MGGREKVKLFDLRDDPGRKNNIAWRNSGIVDRMFRGYIRKDAGGPLPNYDL